MACGEAVPILASRMSSVVVCDGDDGEDADGEEG